MKKARMIGTETIVCGGYCIHVEKMNFAHRDWMERNGLQETETVETETGERFTIFANWARNLACAIPV